MEEIDIEKIKVKTRANVIFLTIRNFGIQGISILGFFILTILLGTGEVGLFAIVAESVAILGYLSDIGLAAALIQQKDEVDNDDLKTTFTIQQSLVILCLIIAVISYIGISSYKDYGTKELAIFAALCISFVISSLKTIPSVLLERKLNFKLLSTIDIVENIIFYAVAVFFAFLGFGAYSYAIAVLTRSIIGLIIMIKNSWWSVGVGIKWSTAKKLFKYGIPYQLNSFIAVAKDRMSNILVAFIIGKESFGILSWAQKGARVPLSFMDAIMKVTFPTFARLQEHHDLLKRSLQKSIYYIALFVFPSLVGISFLLNDIIHIIPKYTKWEPALVPAYIYAVCMAIAAITTPLTNAFNAIGKITTTTKFMIMWTTLTWIFYPLLSWKYGYMGTTFAALIVGVSSFVVWFTAKKQFKINILLSISKPLISSLIMILILLFINTFKLNYLYSLIIKIFTATIFYIIFHLTIGKDETKWFIEQIKCLKFKK